MYAFVFSSITGIGNETIMVKVLKGKTVVLKCSSSAGVSTWLGPDAEQGIDVYFLNNDKNPKLNITNFSLQKNDGGYDLTIVNFLEDYAGCYICRYKNDGWFSETKYDVSLIELLPRTTVILDERGKTLPDNATVYATSPILQLEGDTNGIFIYEIIG
ncbi:Hypothetical predicted protein [Mytilus galloprovincialis]|uniref:Immunoglobulin domain-containing protein n=1 Tax=Mytilus galloprovincialis TaxID=29158 RepID=A0A8B6FPR3_MYTGA|nr:Hypothetical predicted protein [Mytilus galloprovincialis]